MGARTNNRQRLAEVDIVVDISRGTNRGTGGIGAIMMGSGDDVEHSPRVSSSVAADSSDLRAPDMNIGVMDHQDKDEVMVEAQGVGEDRSADEALPDVLNGKAPKALVAPKLGESRKNSGGLSDSVVSNGLVHDTDQVVKNGGSRKRKSKTIHYMNSRVPHAAPALESEEGSDGQKSPEERGDAIARPSQAPRAAAIKVGLDFIYLLFVCFLGDDILLAFVVRVRSLFFIFYFYLFFFWKELLCIICWIIKARRDFLPAYVRAFQFRAAIYFFL